MEFLLKVEAAQKVRVSVPVVYHAGRAGKLAAVRIGRSWKIRSSSLQTYIDRGGGGQSKAAESRAAF
jgi:excisionase family DNA binding protein